MTQIESIIQRLDDIAHDCEINGYSTAKGNAYLDAMEEFLRTDFEACIAWLDCMRSEDPVKVQAFDLLVAGRVDATTTFGEAWKAIDALNAPSK